MPNQFEEFFEEMFSHAMSYNGDPVMKDQDFTHYVLGKSHEQRALAWKNTSRELVQYVQSKTSFVFSEKTGYGIIRFSYTYAAIRWDKEIFWKEIDPIECSLVIEEAKNNMRFADITVMPITKTESSRVVDEDFESTDVYEVVFGQVYIDQCVAKAKTLFADPFFEPHGTYEGESVWFEDEELGKQFSSLSERKIKQLRDATVSKRPIFPEKNRVEGDVSYIVTGLFALQLSIRLGDAHQFTFEVPSKQREELVQFAKGNDAYIPTLDIENVSVPVSLDNLLRVPKHDPKF